MENKITMLTIKEAAAMVEGLTEYRVRQMCVNKQIPCVMAGKKYLINKDILLDFLRGKTE
jgi:excisionase family DNA binding protein